MRPAGEGEGCGALGEMDGVCGLSMRWRHIFHCVSGGCCSVPALLCVLGNVSPLILWGRQVIAGEKLDREEVREEYERKEKLG